MLTMEAIVRTGASARPDLSMAASDRTRLQVGGPVHQRVDELLRDLPHVAGGILEGGRTHSPWPIHRAVQELNSASDELRARGIHVIDLDRELKARSGLAVGHCRRLDELTCR